LFFSIFFILGLSLSFWGWKPLRRKFLSHLQQQQSAKKASRDHKKRQ